MVRTCVWIELGSEFIVRVKFRIRVSVTVWCE